MAIKYVPIEHMNTEEGLDLLFKILPHMETILQDGDYIRLKSRMKADKDLTFTDIVGDAFEIIAVKNRAALYGIVGAMTGKSEEEVKKMPLGETMEMFRGVMGGQVLDFFIFFARTAARM